MLRQLLHITCTIHMTILAIIFWYVIFHNTSQFLISDIDNNKSTQYDTSKVIVSVSSIETPSLEESHLDQASVYPNFDRYTHLPLSSGLNGFGS